jgi:hypothetical protein
VWFNLLQPLNLGDYIPRQQECSFAEWWRKLLKRVKKEYKRGEFSHYFGILAAAESQKFLHF